MINIFVLKDKNGNIVYSQSYISEDDYVDFELPIEHLTTDDIEDLRVAGDEVLDVDSENVGGVCQLLELKYLTKLEAFTLSYEFDKDGKLVEIK